MNREELLDCVDDVDGALSIETMSQKREFDYDAPDDAECWITFGTLRKIEKLFAAARVGAGRIGEQEYINETLERDYRTMLDKCRELEGGTFVPGMWECPTCHFTQVRSFLNASDGTVSADNSELDSICPNEGAAMERVTWQAFAKEMEKRAEELVERVRELERAEERRLF